MSDDVSNLVHTSSEIYNQTELTEIDQDTIPTPIPIDQRIRRGVLIELLPIQIEIMAQIDFKKVQVNISFTYLLNY